LFGILIENKSQLSEIHERVDHFLGRKDAYCGARRCERGGGLHDLGMLLALAVSVELLPPVQPCQHEPSMRTADLTVTVAQRIGEPLAALQLSGARVLGPSDSQCYRCAAQSGQ